MTYTLRMGIYGSIKWVTFGLLLYVVFVLIRILKQRNPTQIELEGVVLKDLDPFLTRRLKTVKTGAPAYKYLDDFKRSSQKFPKNPDILLAYIWLQAEVVESGVFIDSLREDYNQADADLRRWQQTFGHAMRDIEPIEMKLAVLDKRLGNFGV